MLRLRPYKKCDAANIAGWSADERTYYIWGGYRFGDYPVTEEMINSKYFDNNGDCIEEDNFYPFTAFDDTGAVGHFILRYTSGNNRIIRIGWVIVDGSKRGMGYGKEMIHLALEYAFDIFKAEKVTIGVFEKNTPAYKCYLSSGFRNAENTPDSYEELMGENMKIVELEITKEQFKQQGEKCR